MQQKNESKQPLFNIRLQKVLHNFKNTVLCGTFFHLNDSGQQKRLVALRKEYYPNYKYNFTITVSSSAYSFRWSPLNSMLLEFALKDTA